MHGIEIIRGHGLKKHTCILKKRIVVCVFLISNDISKYIMNIFISFTKGTKYLRDLFHKREQ